MHRLTEKNIDTMTAVCEECGPTRVVLKSRGKNRPGQLRCPAPMRESRLRWAHKNPGGLLRYDSTVTPGQSVPEYTSVCELCGMTDKENGRRLALDHNHDTGLYRGWLCNRCNTGLGWFRDDPELLLRAADYIKTRP